MTGVPMAHHVRGAGEVGRLHVDIDQCEMTGAVAVQMSDRDQCCENRFGFANGEAAQPCGLRDRQPQAREIAVFSCQMRKRGETAIEIQSEHGSSVGPAHFIGK